MRDRLIELITKSQLCVNSRKLADQLIANNVIVPPCKVGDSVYCVFSPPYPANPADKGKWFMEEFEVARFHYGVKGLSIEIYGYGTVKESDFGKTVFFTKEAAEEKLKELTNDGKSI